MDPVHVKICGLTQPEQANTIVEMGADAIGVVFAPSKRQVDIQLAAKIVSTVSGAAQAVGVFVNASAEQINSIAEQTGITRAQLHGEESPEIVAKIIIPCWKVFRVRDEHFAVEMHDWLVCQPEGHGVEAVMLDTFSPQAAGGTGDAFNWKLVARMRDEDLLGDLPPLILAGGLDAGNVAEAIRVVQPSMVDVSSGVEESPGRKDIEKVRAFLQAAKGGQ